MTGDNMNKFVAAVVRLGLGFSVLSSAALVVLAVLLIWRPKLVRDFVRFVLAGACLCAAGTLTVGAVRAAWACRK